jgi:nitrile hydratase subunit beta
MNGVHDLGGMHGFGPIEREANEPLFHAAWEARVRAIATLTRDRGQFNIDAFRHGIERMAPAEYLRASYFERWLASVESNLIEHGLLTGDELDARTEFFRRQPGADPPPAAGAATPPRAAAARPEPPSSPPAPRFAVGDAVVTRNAHPAGHTRLPRYARGKRGVIHSVHGPHTFPDTNAHGLGEQPHALYNVRFEGRELWGDSAEPREAVYLDLWESYLEPAPA